MSGKRRLQQHLAFGFVVGGFEVEVRQHPGAHEAEAALSALAEAFRADELAEDLAPALDEARRTARFRCVLAVALRGETLATFAGVIEGRILESPHVAPSFSP